MPKEILKVYANPWLHVDHEGRPACAVRRSDSPDIPGELPSRFVGAVPKVTVKGEQVTVGTLTGTLGGEQHEVEWEFSEEVQTVPLYGSARNYYLQCIRERSLVLANPADARRLGIKIWFPDGKQDFVPAGKAALAAPPDNSLEEEIA